MTFDPSMSARRAHCPTLGVAVDASPAEIKKAYHKQCLRYHPDKNRDPGATETMKRVNHAYEQLTSAGDDEWGSEGESYCASAYSHHSSYNFHAKPQTPRAKKRRRQRAPSGPLKTDVPKDHRIELECTLENLARGAERTQEVYVTRFIKEGRSASKVCCYLSVKIASGEINGHNYRFEKRGNQLCHDGIIGDVVITLRVKPHAMFSCVNASDLKYTHFLKRRVRTGESAKIKMRDVCGEGLNLEFWGPIYAKTVHRIPGAGMPRKDGTRGDLLINFAQNKK